MNESSKKMKALNERMEKFNRKMKQWNYNITSSGDGYSYSYGERQDSESDKEENRDHSRNSTYDASFVRVTDDDQTNEGNNENSHIQTTDYTRDDYFYKKHPRLVNTSFLPSTIIAWTEFSWVPNWTANTKCMRENHSRYTVSWATPSVKRRRVFS
jgi:hypothetical protein